MSAPMTAEPLTMTAEREAHFRLIVQHHDVGAMGMYDVPVGLLAEIDALRARVGELSETRWVYNEDDWETTYDETDYSFLTDDADRDKVIALGRLAKLPTHYLAYIVTERDEEGDEVAGDWQEFETETEANAALDAARAGDTK